MLHLPRNDSIVTDLGSCPTSKHFTWSYLHKIYQRKLTKDNVTNNNYKTTYCSKKKHHLTSLPPLNRFNFSISI